MKFIILQRNAKIPETGINTAYLMIDYWDDFSFKTMFYLSIHDEEGILHGIGNIKIGFAGQTTDKSSYSILDPEFESLPDSFFSVGQDVDYYRKISTLTRSIRNSVLAGLRDIVHDQSKIEHNKHETVFHTSLLRSVSLSVIKGQYHRVLNGHAPLTNFEFKFVRPETSSVAGIDLSFRVEAESMPSTNIHAIIGRNGAGKTTLLNNMVESITSKGNSVAKFYDLGGFSPQPISNDYFSSLDSVHLILSNRHRINQIHL
jgi:hypothetical protein